MSSLFRLKGRRWPQCPSRPYRLLQGRSSNLNVARLHAGAEAAPVPASTGALSAANSLAQASATPRPKLSLGVDTGLQAYPSGRRPCRALNPELGRHPSPLLLSASAYTQTARLAAVNISIPSLSSQHPSDLAFRQSRKRATSLVSRHYCRPSIARTLGSVDRSCRIRSFATSTPAMVATKIDGTAIAKMIRETLGNDILEKQKLNPRFQPTLTIIQGKLASLLVPREHSFG